MERKKKNVASFYPSKKGVNRNDILLFIALIVDDEIPFCQTVEYDILASSIKILRNVKESFFFF